ncbi:conserved hypothetical protein [Aspergillus terreus NIH2624]|uniref:SAC3/GANP/THP3 conserved domain-containing protein n=1 Tax=Aspergillus terreus (strain NIH 2624 / FGSC A1156) TaxID=341663 RepID=Q0CDA8_ASPTN|nr:uncharacterized protein ATEG_08326 [Aspergillus terreus NIH2624]EAU31499.1 conserved hypothetical protein [Aspergillus terreus NIH2624]
MAGAPRAASPFTQKDGGFGSAGRGRGNGSSARGKPYQAGVPGASREFKPRGRGRGSTEPRGGRGRGRGAGAGPGHNTWRKPETATATSIETSGSTIASPFAPLKQNKPASSAFGQPSQPQPFASGFGKASPAPSAVHSTFDGTMVDANRDPRKRSARRGPVMTINGTGEVPVEDLSVLNSYNERYEQLKVDRARERERAIKAGQMADPNQPTNLNQAITPVGTCTSMCPEFERVERIVQKMVDKSEKYLHPSTGSLQNMETKMLKRFRRSAAGYDEQLPSDIRTPKTLLQSMNYLIRHVLGGTEPLGIIHKFVWDRTRSIRNDFSVQQLTQEDDVRIAVTCLERIARFHIVSLHLLSSPANEEPFDRHQEREQLNNTMLSLMYYYDDNRDRIKFPNEDEFRAYYIVFSIHDQRPDLEARVQKWPAELRNSPQVQLALELLAAAGNTWEYQGTLDAKRPNAIAQGFYARFFSLIDSPAVSYLLACVAEIYFNHLRQTAIRSIWKAYCRAPASQQHKNEEWTVDELTTVLYFDDNSQTIQFCEEQDLTFAENANGELYLNWGNRPVDSIAFQPSSDHSFSEKYVESKRGGRSMVAIILGLSIKEAANLGMIDISLLSERISAIPSNVESTMEDDALFVSDEDNETPAPITQQNIITQDGPSPGLFNPFGAPPPAPSGEGTASAASIFSQTTSTFQQPATSQPFSTLFSSTTTSAGNPATHAPSPNPFASLFSSSKEAPVTSHQPSPFPSAPSHQQPASIFGTPVFGAPSQTETKEPKQTPAPPPAAPFSNISNVFKPATTSVSPPFATTTTSPFSQATQMPAPPVDKPAASIFDSTKTPAFGSSSSIFSISGSATASSPEPQPDQKPAQETSSQPFTFPSIAPKADAIAANQEKPLFPSQPTTGKLGAVFAQQAADASHAKVSPPGDQPSPGSDKLAPTKQAQLANGTMPESEGTAPQLSTTTTDEGVSESGKPAEAETAQEAPLAIESAPEEPPAPPEERAGHVSWIESLKAAAENRRRTSSVSRKRGLDDQGPEAPIESGAKPAKVSKPEASVARKKKSMALSSIKPLPKLPILEQVESLTAKKPAEKPEPPKPSQVDEDEILLSAARIAAESLRSGPRLMDSWTTPPDTRRSSFSPRGSFGSPMAFSRSQSPHSSSVHGYDLALAPDTDLGLGRTLSRTEQRLRLTGGKGLAYKPLDFTPKKFRKSK